MNRLIIEFIKIYQALFSPLRIVPHCKYHPSCSEYMQQALAKHGLFLGILKGAWRIIRCNPLSKGGVDLP